MYGESELPDDAVGAEGGEGGYVAKMVQTEVDIIGIAFGDEGLIVMGEGENVVQRVMLQRLGEETYGK